MYDKVLLSFLDTNVEVNQNSEKKKTNLRHRFPNFLVIHTHSHCSITVLTQLGIHCTVKCFSLPFPVIKLVHT